jgi:dTDP-4-dehydrorhamnose reductase
MIWVIGNKGMLGTELCRLLEVQTVPYVGTDRELDFLDPGALADFAKGKSLRWLVNCAAYTAVDKAEDEEGLAGRLNAEGPENLAILARQTGARLLHISTDYVFAGDATVPYAEDSPVNPAGAYGRTKAEGERRVLASSPDAIILRTAWLYGKYGPNFVYTMLRLMKERNSIGVVADQSGTPTWARDLAGAISILVSRSGVPGGIYHYTNEGETTWHDFALAILRLGRQHGLLARDCTVAPLASAQYPTKAHRPAYSVLSKEKIKTLGIPVPAWETSLEGFINDIC